MKNYKAKSCLAFGLLVAALFSSGTASAVMVVDQQPMKVDAMYEGFLSSMDLGAMNADEFVSSNNFILDTITWWGEYDGATPTTDSFTVQLFSDDGGSPGINPSYVIDTSSVSRQPDDAEIFRYSVDVSSANIQLASGSKYYLAVMNDPLDGNANWFWTLGDFMSESWYRAADTDAWWLDSSGNFAMQIEGSIADVVVPEPVTLSLFLLPLIYLGVKLRSDTSA